jgi:cbb3-type cytochrome oxidase subunit 3
MGLLNFGYLHEWTISFFIIFYVATLYWDLRNVDILLRRK